MPPIAAGPVPVLYTSIPSNLFGLLLANEILAGTRLSTVKSALGNSKPFPILGLLFQNVELEASINALCKVKFPVDSLSCKRTCEYVNHA